MKTQVVQLENYDDSVSVRDKMGWGQTKRILLVWPAHGVILERRLDLVLLLRHSQAIGAQLGLVTADQAVKANAKDLGIPVFADTRQAHSGRWRAGKRRKYPGWLRQSDYPGEAERTARRSDLRKERPIPSQNSQKDGIKAQVARWGLFSLSLLALLALAVVLLPSAEIVIEPGTQLQQMTIPIQTSLETTSVNLSGDLPARWTTTVVEGRRSLPVSGKVRVPEKPARGEVIFSNLGANAVTIPAGTIVSTLRKEPQSGVTRYATLAEAKVPAGVNKTTRVRVQAVLPGEEGNQPASAVQAIEGSLGLLLSVTNPTALQGGASLSVPGPTEADREKLYKQLLVSLQHSAGDELINAWQENPFQSSLPVTQTIQVSEVLTRTYIPAGALPAENLELILRVEFKLLTIQGSDLLQFAQPVLDANLETGQQTREGGIQVSLAQALRQDKTGQASGILHLSRIVEQSVTAAEAANLVRGMPVSKAGSLLQTRLNLARPAQVALWPAWWPYLPILPLRIEIRAPGVF